MSLTSMTPIRFYSRTSSFQSVTNVKHLMRDEIYFLLMLSDYCFSYNRALDTFYATTTNIISFGRQSFSRERNPERDLLLRIRLVTLNRERNPERDLLLRVRLVTLIFRALKTRHRTRTWIVLPPDLIPFRPVIIAYTTRQPDAEPALSLPRILRRDSLKLNMTPRSSIANTALGPYPADLQAPSRPDPYHGCGWGRCCGNRCTGRRR